MRVETQIAYILHKRPFRDSSQILDVFSREHGR
ncbi:MAG: recombination protein O N-terminal domain-containing protein, partial [Gammaproteobacteria bacterium]